MIGAPVLVGVDLGGTKITVCVETAAGRTERSWPSSGLFDVDLGQRGRRVAELIASVLVTVEAGSSPRVGIGAHGCDSEEQCAALAAGVRAGLPGAVTTVVNDAELLPLSSDEPAVGVVSGTGSIAVGRSADGEPILAGGWGWLLGDEGGASGIVREAVRAVLEAVQQDPTDVDPLIEAVRTAFDVPSVADLPERVSTMPPDEWADRCRVVFAAADAGSVRALRVIDDAADHLLHLVQTLRRRGVVFGAVVAAGSVVVRQPRLERAFRERLRLLDAPVRLVVLDRAPVLGALRLASRGRSSSRSISLTAVGEAG
ncbi:N-acetylglucosamine kinase [Curtobacterium sp. VKM Ac-1376]|uniref:N-acetylglucosamine kinase n=1 Tax=Curtobacterium sp. VKM Ac-1376 TaxID=123312 RepID=UPI00188A2FFD|nr:BadF/BadG/BcrA/BcrD ATPase family protein [Curtobacterium sp. VKM Ac-1376]MBF4616009.1 hypothetical protein [Curtobacterium sp. VKM Ac-1376]